MKFINNLKHIVALSITLLAFNTITAQEIIEDEKEEISKVSDSVKPFTAQKVDGVAAVVGDYIILDSDIDRNLLQLEAQGVSTVDISRCQLFGKLLEDKLYAHHAIQDSIVVSDAEIHSFVEQQIQAFLQQTNGSMEELLKFYKKDDEKSFRDEMFEINKSGKLSSEMQKKIIDEIEITPDEVRQFFNKIPKLSKLKNSNKWKI